jgi:hypothetical protein
MSAYRLPVASTNSMQPQHHLHYELFGVDHLLELIIEDSSFEHNLVTSCMCSTAVLHKCDECLPFAADVFHYYYYYLTPAPEIYIFLTFTSGKPYISTDYFQLVAVVCDGLRCSEKALGVRTRSLILIKYGRRYICHILYQVTVDNLNIYTLSIKYMLHFLEFVFHEIYGIQNGKLHKNFQIYGNLT